MTLAHKSRFIRSNYVLLLVILAGILFCCAPKDPATIASEVAAKWAADNADSVSKSIAGLAASDNPLVGTAIKMIISNEINRRISWQYAPPQELAEDKYAVVTTAYTEIEVPVLGEYRASVNYNLEIDTKAKRVISAGMDTSSFAVTRQ